MNYFVVGSDGKDYGPVGVDTLKQWVADQRVNHSTVLKEQGTSRSILASEIPGLLPPMPQAANYAAPPPPPAMPQNFGGYPRIGMMGQQGMTNQALGNRMFGWVLFRCFVAIAIACFWRFGGIITAAYAAFYAYQCKTLDHKHAHLAIALVVLTFIIVITMAFALPSRGIGF
jgi:hypothetical protein